MGRWQKDVWKHGRSRGTSSRALVLKLLGHPVKLVDGIHPFQLEQLQAITRLNPGDAEVGDQEPHDMGISEIGDKGDPALGFAIAADITTGHLALVLKTTGQGLKTQDQVLDNGSVLLSQTGKHEQPTEGG
jgi:hypothetical protein